MFESDVREKLKTEIQASKAPELLPHHQRDALLVVSPGVDILDVAVAIAADNAELVSGFLADGRVYKPSLAQLSDWCVDLELRFQFVILQPYVLAQPLDKDSSELDTSQN